jgi:predicted polyphosphate/ATP-dependent NAD kinase
MKKFRLGFLMNPYAGIGGPAGFKGSDLPELQKIAREGSIPLRAPERANTFWQQLKPALKHIEVVAAPAQMGADWLRLWGVEHRTVDYPLPRQTTAQDTVALAKTLHEESLDLLVFVGGDGTARDIYTALGEHALVLGIPSGVKMHSAVYAINPQCAAELLLQLLKGELVAETLQEVRDIDETLFRQGKVSARYFGQMRVPALAQFIQAVKQGGFEVEELVLLDIATHLREALSDQAPIIWAPGSTTFGVLKEWGYEGTLLGVDVLMPSGDLIRDVNSDQLQELLSRHDGGCELVLTAIGGQGHIIGRGNQQISTDILRVLGRDHVHVIATRTKLLSLSGRPLLLDTGCPLLDSDWSGLMPVITGYHDVLIYPVGI